MTKHNLLVLQLDTNRRTVKSLKTSNEDIDSDQGWRMPGGKLF